MIAKRECREGSHNQGAETATHLDWCVGLAAFQCYVAKRGSVSVPRGARARGVAVGEWVHSHRKAYWAGRLLPSQVEMLENIPGWSWSGPPQRRWHRCLAALSKYAFLHQSADVGPDVTFNGLRIGAWAAAQRVAYASGTLPAPNAALLAALPGWRWTENHDRWNSRLEAARNHRLRDASAHRARMSEVEIARWLARCQADYRAGSLPPDRVAQLEALPEWRWNDQNDRWAQGLSSLRAYVALHGHARPPQSTVADGFALGRWVNEARRQYRLGNLPLSRRRALERLPSWQWNVFDAAWQDGLDTLRRYTALHLTATPKTSTIFDGFRLGQWVYHQRARYRRGRLTKHRIEQLEALPGWTWSVGRRNP
jgi:hypothetical protein